MKNPHVSRLLEQSNDVEKNPGPPKVVKNGLIANKMPNNANNGKKQQEENGLGDVHNLDDLKVVVEKQNETIKAQKAEIELLRKQMEKNVHLTQDFQSELSEIRKNWQTLENSKNGGGGSNAVNSATGNSKEKTLDDVLLRLEALSSAYTDIQDRLYELDKSWKNNLMIYGVPCCDGEEDDPVITEEKVKEVLLKKLHISRDILMNRVHRLNYGPDFRGHKPIQVCLVNYRDKEEILRKARLLKGSNIYISEDFSRKVREHRNELIKFMKEVKSRDPTRRMTLRYDKLYIGNDVFFFNDRTGRVERLHTPLEVGNNNFSNLMNDNNSSYHDSSWLRRPRSRMGLGGNNSMGSRCATPLSRQNSMSMEDFSSSMPPLNNATSSSSASVAPRVTSSARFRRSNPGSPRKSVSIDSLHQHSQQNYYQDMDSNPPSQQQSRQNSAGPSHHGGGHQHHHYNVMKPEYTLDTYIPATSTVQNGYYAEPVRSNPGSPSKRVAFKGLPNAYNHPVAPYQSFDMANPRIDTPMMMNPDDMLAIEADANNMPRVSYPALMNGINNVTTSAMTPYVVNSGGQRAIVPASKALVTPNNHVVPSNYPPLDYGHHHQLPAPVQQHQQQPLMTMNKNGLINNPAQYAIDNALKKNSSGALPAIMAPNTGAVQPYVNGISDSEDEVDNNDRKLELEYKNNENNGNNNKKAIEDNSKKSEVDNKNQGGTTTTSTTNNGVIKVAMVGEISMSNFHQCK